MAIIMLFLAFSDSWTTPQTGIFRPLTPHAVFIDRTEILIKNDIGVMVFDHQGRHLGNIGKKGNGPGELPMLIDFAVTEKALYLQGTAGINVFDRKGHFLEKLRKPGGMVLLQNVGKGWVGLDGLSVFQKAEGKDVSLMLFDEKMTNPRTLYSWKNSGSRTGTTPYNDLDTRSFNPVQEHPFLTIDGSGRYAIVKLEGSDKIFIFDTENNDTLKALTFDGPRIPFDVDWGKAALAFINEAQNTNLIPDFPEFFPRLESIGISVHNRLAVRLWKSPPPVFPTPEGWNNEIQVFDFSGNRLQPTITDHYVDRIAGIHKDWVYVIIQTRDDAYSLEKVHVADVPSFLKEHPLAYD